MHIYYEGKDTELEESVKAQLIPSTSLANEEVEAVWLDLEINIERWNMGAVTNATEGEFFSEESKWDQVAYRMMIQFYNDTS